MKRKILNSIFLLSLVLGPSLARADTAPAAFDLSAEDVGYENAGGQPTKVLVKNLGTADFNGKVRMVVKLVDANGNWLPESVGALSYGTDTYYQKSNDDTGIKVNESRWVDLTEGWNYRHREAVKVKVDLRIEGDHNRGNDIKILDLPMPDLYPRAAYVQRQEQYDEGTSHFYLLKYEIANGGLVGYKAGATVSEPQVSVKVKYNQGRDTEYSSNIAYQLRENIPAGSQVHRELGLQLDRNRTPQTLTIIVDDPAYGGGLFESNEVNNTLTQDFSITSPPDPSALMARGREEVLADFQDGVRDLGLIDQQKLFGAEIKPCSSLESLKDAKDGISNALTWSKNKKAENKIKQAASKAQLINKVSGKDEKCLRSELDDYKDTQKDVATSLAKLDKKDHNAAQDLAGQAVKNGIAATKVVNLLVADTGTLDAVKKAVEETEKDVSNNIITNAKLITDEAKLTDTLQDAFGADDSIQMSLLNLDMIENFKEAMQSLADTLAELERENAIQAEIVMADFDKDAVDQLEEFMADLSIESEGGDGEADNQDQSELRDLFDSFNSEEITSDEAEAAETEETASEEPTAENTELSNEAEAPADDEDVSEPSDENDSTPTEEQAESSDE